MAAEEDPWAIFGEEPDHSTSAAPHEIAPPSAAFAAAGVAAAGGPGNVARSPLGPSAEATGQGFYCSTSGTYFPDKESLQEHYRSDFHRCNLKRRAADLPPVSKEWFEARKAQLLGASTSAQARVWICPLTNKKFSSENTYRAWTQSKKYRDLVKKSGGPAPEVIVRAAPAAERPQVPAAADGQARADEDDDASGDWETASDEGSADAQWEEWDEKRCLFCSKGHDAFSGNLDHMYKAHGFFLPDAEFLKDPEGLVRYLGMKLSVGHFPLYVRGDDPDGKQFRSLRAVQQHMLDSNKCFMVYDDNEEEYEEFYDYSRAEEEKQLSNIEVGVTASGYELTISDSLAGTFKILGTREFLRYYRQRPRLPDTRQSAVVRQTVAKYRDMSLPTQQTTVEKREAFAQRKSAQVQHRQMKNQATRGNVIRDLPKNVPY